MDLSHKLILLIKCAVNIFFLQEHWLYSDELPLRSQLHAHFADFGLFFMWCLNDKKYLLAAHTPESEYYCRNIF